MNFDLGLAPLLQLFLTGALVAISSNILIDYFSYYFSLSTRRFQKWTLDQVRGKSLHDFFLFILLQLISFRKKAFFHQLGALINVRTFNVKQNGVILLASFIGIGVSTFLLSHLNFYIPILIIMGTWGLKKYEYKEMIPLLLSLVCLILFGLLLDLFDSYLSRSALNIHTYKVGPAFILLISFLTSHHFRTPLAFLVSFSFLYVFMDINSFWFPIFFLIHSLVTYSGFYLMFIGKHSRTYHSLFLCFVFQIFQFLVSFVFTSYYFTDLKEFLRPEGFLSSFKTVILLYSAYQVLPLLLLAPFVMIFPSFLTFPFLTRTRGDTQKIIYQEQKSNSFSIHLSIYLLRQEFKKYLTTILTLYDWSKQIVNSQLSRKERFEYYHGVLNRVGEEIKELSLKATEHKAPADLTHHIMSFYKEINKLDSLVQSLNRLILKWIEMDQTQQLNEAQKKVAVELIKNQVLVFENYFNSKVGLPVISAESKIKNLVEGQKHFETSLFDQDIKVESSLLTNQLLNLLS